MIQDACRVRPEGIEPPTFGFEVHGKPVASDYRPSRLLQLIGFTEDARAAVFHPVHPFSISPQQFGPPVVQARPSQLQPPPGYLLAADAAKRLRTSEAGLRRRIFRGSLCGRWHNGELVVAEAELARYARAIQEAR